MLTTVIASLPVPVGFSVRMTARGLKRDESKWPGVSWLFFRAMVGRGARAGTGFARDALHATITM
jgi:hypothetical protein